MSQNTVTTEQVHELIEQMAAMTAAASITPEIVANIFEKMRNLNDQERLKVIEIAEAKIAEIQNIGIAADHVTLDSGVTVEEEMQKKAYMVELDQRSASLPLPVDATYYYKGLPTHSVVGTAYDSENEIFTDYIGICINHEDDSGFEPQHHDVMVFVKSSSNYIYSETFNTSEASGYLEEHIARAFGSVNATPSYSGLMSAEDKRMFEDVVTEVFPIKVAIASSNAGTREIGTAVIPSIELNITRKGNDVAASANVEVTPDDGSLSQNKKTYTGALISSGSKTYQIAVTQGGQTVNAPAQTFSFLNYRYYGAVSTKPANAAAVKTLCQNGTLTKQLSSSTTMGKTALAASKYFVFVVPNTSVSLIVKNANSGGTVDNAGAGTVEIARVNGTADLNYKYVIVPASSNAWNFEIVNS